MTITRKLGNLEVSALGLGCWAIGGPFWAGEQPLGWGEVDDEESIRAIHAGLDLGANFLDTADVYGAGHSERVLARALKGRRDKVVIATKFGNTFDETSKQTGEGNASPAYIRQACEASLRRLDTDYIDLYQFHLNGYPAEDAAPVRDSLEDLVKEGKIRAYGWSTDFPERAAVFAEGEHCAAIQHDLNVIADNAPLLAFIEAHGLASINRGPLGMGLLSGKYDANTQLAADDIRGKSPDWMQYFSDGVPNPDWLAKLAAIREILTSGGRTLAQGALAWIWGRSLVTIPIPGFRTVKQVTENVGALAFGPLTADQVKEIDGILGR